MTGLDGVRGLAILGVIAFHTLRVEGNAVGVLRLWRAVQESTWAGVDLFFVLSGFLITGILVDSRQRAGYFRNFYARRTLRIMPLYYAVVAFALLIVPALLGASRLPPLYARLTANQFWLWTYLQNYLQAIGPHQLPGFGHFWTLAVEEQFYWFWPLIIYLIATRVRLFRFCVAICLIEPILRFTLLHFGFTGWALRQYTFTRIDTLMYGAIAALLLRDKTLLPARRYLTPVLLATSAVVLGVIMLSKGFIPYEAPETVIAGYSAMGIIFAAFVYASALGTNILTTLMSVPVLRWLGRYSYGIYVFHPPLQLAYDAAIARHHLTSMPFLSAGIEFTCVTLVSAGIAWVSWTVFESKFIKLKRYFEFDEPSPSTAITGGQNDPVTYPASASRNDAAREHAPEFTRAGVSGLLSNLETNRPNRILFLVTTLGIGGGAENQVVSLATELKARNWEVWIASMISGDSSYVSQVEQQQHIEVHSLHMKAGIPDFRAVFRLRALIRDFRPDVVHCHMFHPNILGRITRLFCRMPLLICTAHNLRETSRSGGPTWHKELIYRMTDSLSDQTTIICKAGYDRYLRVGAAPRHKLQVIPNGVDTDVFTRSSELRSRARNAYGIGSEFVWLAVGRLVKQKDYPTLFRALAMMQPKNFILLIAGRGPLETEFREYCTKHGLSQCVRFCGTGENVVALYNAADAFVMSSEFEGLSMALLEAASVGLPAVVTDVGGNPEIVTDNVTGYLVPPAAPAQLAATMQRLMSASPETRSAMGLAAQQHCREHYRIATIIDQWLDLYTQSMSATQSKRIARNVVTSSEEPV